MDDKSSAPVSKPSRWQQAMAALAVLTGVLPPLQILAFMSKSFSLQTPGEWRLGCYYPLLTLAAMGATVYAVADGGRRRLPWRILACLLTLVLFVPAVEWWCLLFEARTSLVPPYYGLWQWFPIPVNLLALATTVRLSRREWKLVAAVTSLGMGALVAIALPPIWPIVVRIRHQYPPAREITELGEKAHIRWDDFWVTGVRAPETRIAHGKADLLYEFPQLRRLDLAWTGLGDAEMRYIDTLARLQEVNLSRTQISDATLEKLSRLPELSSLDVGRTAVTDAGLERLVKANPQRLKELMLDDTRITTRGFQALGKLKGLRHLSLSWTAVQDADLEHLADMESLTHLCLNNTAITDQGLEHLLALPNLDRLEVERTDVTAEGVARWQDRREKTGHRCDVWDTTIFLRRTKPAEEADKNP